MGGTRDEKDGGPGRVLRCKMRLGTALVGVKSVDFLPLYLFSILFCSHWEPKTCKYWPGTIGTTSECIFKMSAAREKRLHAAVRCLVFMFLSQIRSFGWCQHPGFVSIVATHVLRNLLKHLRSHQNEKGGVAWRALHSDALP